MRVVALLYSDPAVLVPVAEASLQWTPGVAVSHEAVFLEIGKCRRLYREETLLLRLRVLNNRLGFKPKTGVANDPSTALALARFQLPRRELLPVEAMIDYFSPWKPTDALNGLVSSLRKLGILKLKEFLSLPAKTLSERFGKDALEALRKIREADRILWPAFARKETIAEKMEITPGDEPVSLEPLLFLIKGLVDRTMIRLKGRGEKASVVQLTLEQEPFSTLREPLRNYPVHLSVPQGRTAGLLPILKDRLESEWVKNPLVAPLTSIAFEISEGVPAREGERDFFQRKEEDEEARGSLVSRLAEKLGKEKVFVASPVQRYLPEKSWKKEGTRRPEKEPPVPLRPLRLFKAPEAFMLNGAKIQNGRKGWTIEKIEGPERLSGEWWFEPFERDYFKVTASSGEILWIFRKPGSVYCYLHGIFD
jgi:hypothetical protein